MRRIAVIAGMAIVAFVLSASPAFARNARLFQTGGAYTCAAGATSTAGVVGTATISIQHKSGTVTVTITLHGATASATYHTYYVYTVSGVGGCFTYVMGDMTTDSSGNGTAAFDLSSNWSPHASGYNFEMTNSATSADLLATREL